MYEVLVHMYYVPRTRYICTCTVYLVTGYSLPVWVARHTQPALTTRGRAFVTSSILSPVWAASVSPMYTNIYICIASHGPRIRMASLAAGNSVSAADDQTDDDPADNVVSRKQIASRSSLRSSSNVAEKDVDLKRNGF